MLLRKNSNLILFFNFSRLLTYLPQIQMLSIMRFSIMRLRKLLQALMRIELKSTLIIH
jgi:hypothetical protein